MDLGSHTDAQQSARPPERKFSDAGALHGVAALARELNLARHAPEALELALRALAGLIPADHLQAIIVPGEDCRQSCFALNQEGNFESADDGDGARGA